MTRRHVLRVLARGLAGLVACALGSPLAYPDDPAQRVVRLCFVDPNSLSTAPRSVNAFWERLRELGWTEGQNLIVERRWAEGRIERLPTIMAEVTQQKIDVLVTFSTPAAIAAKNATSTVPIVVLSMGDPVGMGLAASLARPGGNLTGLSLEWGGGIAGKWLELLQEAIPRLSTVAVIGNPENPLVRNLVKQLEAVAPAQHLKLRIIEVHKPEAIDGALMRARHAQAILVLADPLTISNRRRITALAAKYRLAGLYPMLDFVDAGGLMAYGVDQAVLFRRAADYVDKILKGARPADLPIEQPTQWTLVVNLKTAKALGITIPESILVRADQVIK